MVFSYDLMTSVKSVTEQALQVNSFSVLNCKVLVTSRGTKFGQGTSLQVAAGSMLTQAAAKCNTLILRNIKLNSYGANLQRKSASLKVPLPSQTFTVGLYDKNKVR